MTGISSSWSAILSVVSGHDIAGIWVAFFSRCQRYRCRQDDSPIIDCRNSDDEAFMEIQGETNIVDP